MFIFLYERFALYYTFFYLSTLFRHFSKKLFLCFLGQNKKLVISLFYSILWVHLLLLILKFFFIFCLQLRYFFIITFLKLNVNIFLKITYRNYYLFSIVFSKKYLMLIHNSIFKFLCQYFFLIFLNFY